MVYQFIQYKPENTINIGRPDQVTISEFAQGLADNGVTEIKRIMPIGEAVNVTYQ